MAPVYLRICFGATSLSLQSILLFLQISEPQPFNELHCESGKSSFVLSGELAKVFVQIQEIYVIAASGDRSETACESTLEISNQITSNIMARAGWL
jgi:hypothetical protein